uniref:Uncharacterized protein n=1 Tax=Arion vulgaris TaxID=1028688 RepID=A0A0B7B9I5_9EUPU
MVSWHNRILSKSKSNNHPSHQNSPIQNNNTGQQPGSVTTKEKNYKITNLKF